MWVLQMTETFRHTSCVHEISNRQINEAFVPILLFRGMGGNRYESFSLRYIFLSHLQTLITHKLENNNLKLTTMMALLRADYLSSSKGERPLVHLNRQTEKFLTK